MIPVYCSLTGADDRTNPADLIGLSERFPFAEWAILYDLDRGGSPRYPTQTWISALIPVIESHAEAHFALHVCRRALAELIEAPQSPVSQTAHHFKRVQLNFDTGAQTDPTVIRQICARYDEQTIIIPYNAGLEHLVPALGDCHNLAVLFDSSKGRGHSPESWPSIFTHLPCGYAGGLGPETLSEQWPRIKLAANRFPFWIDMETSLRGPDNEFSLHRVEQVLAFCAAR